jgi:hypothetical protein
LTINSQYSFRKKGETYNPNTPSIYAQLDRPANAHVARATLRWTPANKYATYPHYKDNEGSKYPVFSLTLKKAFKLESNSTSYESMIFQTDYNNLTMGLLGNSEFKFKLQGFLATTKNSNNINSIDYNHFNGNETFVNLTAHYMNGFMTMPYYKYSTFDPTMTVHWQHHFNGYILDKIPLIRKLRFSEVFRAAYAYTPQFGSYVEFGAGIDNIGWGLFRFLRVDFVWNKSFESSKIDGTPKILIGLKM